MKYFPPFRFDHHLGLLRRAGREVPLTRKAAALLGCLLDQPGGLVSHQAIMRTVWPETHVQPDNIKALIHELRSALGDHPHTPAFIRSDPGRGYTFVAGVTEATLPLFSEWGVAGEPVLVGRDAETASIARLIEAAADGCEPQLILIEGERGLGKTSLCAAVAHHARKRAGARISCGQALEVWASATEPYAVLMDAFDLLARQYPHFVPPAFARRAPAWLGRFPHWPDARPADGSVLSHADVGAEQVLRELAGVLDEIAADDLLLVFLEDLQWADVPTIEALRLMTRQHASSRLCVVATYSGGGDQPAVEAIERLSRDLRRTPGCTTIRLAPLTEAELFLCLDRRLGPNAARRVAKPLYRVGGGNPWFTVVAIDNLVKLGALHSTATGWQVADRASSIDTLLSASLADVLQSQIDRLSPSDRLIIKAAATIGPEFAARAVTTALGSESRRAVAYRLEALALRHVLVDRVGRVLRGPAGESTRYRFRHPLVADLLLDRSTASGGLRTAALRN